MKFGPVEKRLMEDIFGTGSNTSMRNGRNEVLVPREEEWKSRTPGASRTDGHVEARVIGWNACRLIYVVILTGGIGRLKGPLLTPRRGIRQGIRTAGIGLPISDQDET